MKALFLIITGFNMYKKLEFYENLYLGDDYKLNTFVEGKMMLIVNSFEVKKLNA